jgi:hypothetical protein
MPCDAGMAAWVCRCVASSPDPVLFLASAAVVAAAGSALVRLLKALILGFALLDVAERLDDNAPARAEVS